jgi:GNAT superfamily N-acetyltransferase
MGVWLTTAMRVAKGWGHPPEDAWRYEPQIWPPPEPPGIDEAAKNNRTTAYTRCRTLADSRTVLKSGGGVLAAFQIDASWRESDGNIDDPRDHKPEATHSLLLFGCDDDTETFRFAHNWGPDWGEEGFGNLPYRYWSDRFLEAWVPDDRRVASVPTDGRTGTVVIYREAPHWRGDQIRMIEIEDVDRDEFVGWSIMVETSESLELEELFVRPAYRGAGHGRTLAKTIDRLRARLQLPLKAWVSHPDWPASPAQEAVLAHLGLTVMPSAEKWAAASS